ncbi:MAG: HU family DNA-binding protein [Bacteroidales bacterium]|nr:HU family DNA-binding protein [Bacteroidales bacterium]
MDHNQLVKSLAESMNKNQEEIDSMINSMISVIKDSVCELDSVSFPGFGAFEPKKRQERISVNPATGKRMLIPPKIILNFRPSVMLRQRVRNIIDKSF